MVTAGDKGSITLERTRSKQLLIDGERAGVRLLRQHDVEYLRTQKEKGKVIVGCQTLCVLAVIQNTNTGNTCHDHNNRIRGVPGGECPS